MAKKKLPSKRTQTTETPIKASGIGKKMGLPTLALETVKLAAKPSFNKFSAGLGTLPNLVTPPAPDKPDLPVPQVPISAGMNSMQATQVQTAPAKEDGPNKDMVVAASMLASSFAQTANTVHLAEGDDQKFLDISAKILEYVKKIEEAMVDEQDTSIVRASEGPATTIVQQPFLPTEAPVPTSDPLSKMLSMAGLLVAGIGTALTMGAQWLGTMWFGFADKLASQIKKMFALGWSRVVTGFNMASDFVSNSVSTVMKWVDASMATVSRWVTSAAEQIKRLWSAFDFSKLNILDFDLKGLWAKMQDLSIFGEWGKALKTALGIFGGTGLDTLKTIFDTVGKVWNFVKPIVKILGKVARFLGPIGFLFGLATMADDIIGLVGDASAILGMPTTEAKITGVKTLVSKAMRMIAETILPEWIVDQVLNSRDENEANEKAQAIGAVEATGSTIGKDYKISNPGKLNDLSINDLQHMINSNDYNDADKETLKLVIDAKKARGEDPDGLSDEEPAKATEMSQTAITPTVVRMESGVQLPDAGVSTTRVVWQPEAEAAIKKVLDEKAEISKARDYDVKIINDAITAVKLELIEKFVKTAKVHETEFETEFEMMRSKILDRYYYNTNHQKILEVERELRVQPMAVRTVTTAPLPTSSIALSSYTASGSISVAAPAPVVIDAKPEPGVPETANVPPDPSVAAGPAPETGTTKAQAASDFATRHAEAKSTGYCARYVRRGLQAAGYQFQQQATAKEYVTNGTLQKMGFTQVSMKEPPQKGDISVMGPRYPGHAGHISIFNGRNWVSDFVQRHESPYLGGRPYPGQWMTRWRDTGSPGKFDPSAMAAYEASMAPPNLGFMGATAQQIDLSGMSTNMSDILNQALAALGLGKIQMQPQQPSNKPQTKAPSDKTDLELDQLLYLQNGFN